MECIYQRQTAMEPEAEVSSSVCKNCLLGKAARSVDSDPTEHLAVPEDTRRNAPRSSNMKQPNATVIEVKGKVTLSVIPDAGNDAKIQIENIAGSVFSLTVQGCVNLKCYGENEQGTKTNVKQTVPCANCCSSKENIESHDIDKSDFTKSHRRNNSDYLFVSGERQQPRTSTCSEEDIVETRSVEETSTVFMNSEGSVLDNHKNLKCHARKNEDNIDGADMHQVCTSFASLGENCVGYKRRNMDDRVNLAVPIRENFTLLLQEIRLISLCDHLYQNYVIDMETFQSVYDANRNGRATIECIRCLLLHLSRGSVKEGALRKSLVDSDHTTIIPLLLNGSTGVPHRFA